MRQYSDLCRRSFSLRQVKQYIHASGQFLNLNGRMGSKIYPGDTIENQVSFVDVRMLQKEDFRGNLMCSRESYDGCIYGVMTRLMMQSYGCTSPWVIDQKICTRGPQVHGAFMISYDRVTNQFKDCLAPCDFFMITVGARNLEHRPNDTFSIQRYSFPQRVLLTQEHYLYPFLTLAAEIGGYVGLLLGISLMNGTSLIHEWFQRKILRYQELL